MYQKFMEPFEMATLSPNERANACAVLLDNQGQVLEERGTLSYTEQSGYVWDKDEVSTTTARDYWESANNQ